jgi:dihydroneopterin aldolase/2-amino-4-hydroxy-6-hydroxymethyldihydropteridine diphosphokinase/dihydropteroate synthase
LSQDDIYITLTVKKPSAIALASHPTFKITRCLKDYSKDLPPDAETPVSALIPPLRPSSTKPTTNDPTSLLGLEDKPITAYLAIGTNLGDRIKNIQDALAALPRISEESIGVPVTAQRFLHVTKCSQLYESEPMYVVDQPQFINGAIQVCSPRPSCDEAHALCRYPQIYVLFPCFDI